MVRVIDGVGFESCWIVDFCVVFLSVLLLFEVKGVLKVLDVQPVKPSWAFGVSVGWVF